MKYSKQIRILLALILVTGVSYGAKAQKTVSKEISTKDVAKYIGKTVTIESKVIEIEHAGQKALIELTDNFKVVVDTTAKAALTKVGIDVESLPGSTVKITGKLYKHPQYGVQMDLTKVSQIVITKKAEPGTTNSASASSTRTNSQSSAEEKVIPFKEIISVSEVTTHIGQTGTIEGKVVKASKSARSNTYFLNFSDQQKVFTVVIFSKVAEQFAKDSVDPLSFQEKKVQVKGKIQSPAQYGPEILLDKAEDIKIIK